MTQIGGLVLLSTHAGDVTPEDGVILGKALAVENRRVVVSRDIMHSSAAMAEAVISGLLFQGADVIDAGILSAPAASLATSEGDCGVYVAGNYGETSGYWVMNKDGSLFRDEQIRHLEVVLKNQKPNTGSMGSRWKFTDAERRYEQRVIDTMDAKIQCSAVLDCSCGTTAGALTTVFNVKGADIVMINAQPDPDFMVDSSADNGPKALENYVRSSPGSIGIRLNPIGTSVEVIDENGELVPMEVIFALLAQYLKPKCIVVTVETTSLIEDTFLGKVDVDIASPVKDRDEDRRVIITENNASLISEATSDADALGFFDGNIVFGRGAPIGDGIMTAIGLVSMAGDNSINRLSSSLPEYLRNSKSVKCSIKADVFKRAVNDNLDSVASRCTLYGNTFRVVMDEGWFIVRHMTEVDGTYSIRIMAESRDKAYLVGLMEMAEELVDKSLHGV